MTKTTVDFENLFKKLSISDERLRILNFLKAVGFDSVHVNYSGGGDSGSVDSFNFFPTPSNENTREVAQFVENMFEEVLSQPIWDKHGSFADGGGFSVSGSVIWNVEEKSVVIQGTDCTLECDEEGEETESNYEDWVDDLYLYEEGEEEEVLSLNGEQRYDCLLGYAMCFMKDKFPGEFHNRMVAAAMVGDSDAVRYVKWCENGFKEKI